MIHDGSTGNVAIIAAYTLLCHGVILLNDGLLWDGWMVDSWQRNRTWSVMRRFFAETGLLPQYYVHRALSKVPARIFAYRLIAFGSTLVSGVAIYFLAAHSGILGEFHSLLLALLYLSYTGYHMNVDTVVGIQYTLPTALFYWAAYLALLSADDGSGPVSAALRIASLLLFFAAFNANSLLVYYFGFLGLTFLSGWDFADDAGSNLYRQVINHLDFSALPFAFWFLKNWLTPRHGHYTHYNRIEFRPFELAMRILGAIRFGFEAAISSPLRSAVAGYFLWVPLLAFAWILSQSIPLALPHAPSPAALLAVGAVLFLLAALPYALVGISFLPDGWTTRNHMLFHLPVALIQLAATAWLSPAPMLATIAFLLVCNAIHLNLIYLHHLAVTVKNRSWLQKLAEATHTRSRSIFLIADYHSIRGDQSSPGQEHRPAYLFYMFEWLWGGKTRCGFPVPPSFPRRLSNEEVSSGIASTTLDYDMQQVNRRGTQLKVLITDGIGRSATKTSLLYLRHRYFPGGNVKALLEGVTDVQFVDFFH